MLFVTSVSAQHPTIGGYNVYYGDIHNHSYVSDGTGSPAAAYDYAKYTAHLDFFSLTDHSEQTSAEEWADIKSQANRYNEDGIFTAFYGFEWSSNRIYGNAGVINTDDYCAVDPPTDTFEGFINWLSARPGGIAFFNHPGKENYVGLEFNYFATAPSDQIVGMELWNRGDAFNVYYYNDGYYPGDNKGYFDEALERGWKIGAMGANDNHSGTWGTSYPYRMAILANNLTRADLLSAMQAHRFYSTLDKNLSLSFRINGMEMGSTIAGSDFTAQIQAKDGDGELFSRAVLYNKNHDIVNTWTLNTSTVDISFNLSTADGDYYYVIIRQADGDEAISSPIWISGSTSNKYPLCSISTPSNGAAFVAPANILINANATDPDGSVSKVEFYQGATKLGEDVTSPFNFSWERVSAGSYKLTVKATDNKGAVSTSSSISINVTGIPITVTARAGSKVYGETDPALTYRITSGSLLGTDTFTGSLTRDQGENTGNYTIRKGTLALKPDYALTLIEANMEITARPITVEADDSYKAYGEADRPLTFSITSGSLVRSDAFSGVQQRETGENVGNYAVTQGSLELSSNYTLTYKGANLVITARPVTVTADANEKVYGEGDFLSYRVTSGTLAGADKFTGDLMRDPGENVGTYAIRQGTLALNSNYSITFRGSNFTVTRRVVTVAADPGRKIYGESDPGLTYQVTSGSLVQSDTFSGSLGRDGGENAGRYSIRQGNLALSGNYNLLFSGSYLDITPRHITVTADSRTKTYGESDPPLTYRITSGNLAGIGDIFTGTLIRQAGEDAGSYAINQGTLNLNSNYELTYVGSDLIIEKSLMFVSADQLSKIYGDPDRELTYHITSGALAGGDAFTGELSRDPGEDAGRYAIRPGTLGLNNNYTIIYSEAEFEIVPRSVTITANNRKKEFGESDPELTYIITSGTLSGADAITGGLTREPGEDVGTYEITQGDLALGDNYSLNFIGADFRVTSGFEVKVFPNPFKEHLIFEFELNKSAFISINLFNMSGIKIATAYSCEFQAGSYRLDYNTERIGKGLIIYQLIRNGQIVVKGKLIRQ